MKHEKKQKGEGKGHDGKFIGKAQAVGYDSVEAKQEGAKGKAKEPGCK